MMPLRIGISLLTGIFAITLFFARAWIGISDEGATYRFDLQSGWAVLATFFAMLFIFVGLGYSFLNWFGGMKSASRKMLFLSPAVGLIIAGFIFGAASALGLFGNAMTGVVFLAASYPATRWILTIIRSKKSSSISLWVLVVAVICCYFYTIPFANGNGKMVAVQGASQPTQQFQYIDVDPSYDAAVTSVLMHSSPPHMPGMASSTLHYHYASHAIAAAIGLPVSQFISAISNRFTQANSENSSGIFNLARSSNALAALHSAFLFSLILALMLLGELIFARRKWLSLILMLTALFGGATILYRYGIQAFGSEALTEILNDVLEFKFNRLLIHYYQFHSLVWTALGLTVIFTLLGINNRKSSWLPSVAAVISVMLIPFNFIAGAGLAGVVAITTLAERRNNWIVSEAFIIVLGSITILLFGGLAHLEKAPLVGSTEALAYAGQIGIPLAQRLLRPWPELLLLNIDYVLFNFPLAVLIIFGYVNFHNKYRTLWIASLVWLGGFLFAATFLNGDFNLALYSMLNLQIMAMMLNAIAIMVLWTNRSTWGMGMKWTMIGVGVIALLGLLLTALTSSSVYWVIPPLISLLMVYLLTKPAARLPLLIVASIWTILAFGWMFKFNPTMVAAQTRYSPGFHYKPEVELWAQLFDQVPAEALIATNRHDLDAPNGAGLSYICSATTGRRFFLEGYRFGEQRTEGFKEILRDNQTIFNSSDPDSVWEVLERRKIDYILCKPNTDLAAREALPTRLELVSISFLQSLYRVVR